MGEKHTTIEVHMIPRYVYIHTLFITVLLEHNVFLRHMLVVYDRRIFRELIFPLSLRFFPRLQNSIHQFVLENFTVS
jgi:hypothetical protein